VIVAITGGTGFIGRHLITRHIARGDEVRYLTRKASVPAIEGATAIIGDLGVVDSLRPLVQGADVLYHCAAELHNAERMHDANVSGTKNLLTAAQGEVKRWVQLSSTGVYGSKPVHDVNEDTPINPVNAYELSKAAADELVYQAMTEGWLQGVILRPSNVYGVDMPNQSLFQLINMIRRGWFFFIGEKGAIANYIHVENVVDALILCGTATLPANARTYIVSDFRRLEDFVAIIAGALTVHCPSKRMPESFVRLIARLADYLPRFPLSSSRVNALTYRYHYQTSKIESELGYQQQISMEAGISELVRSTKQKLKVVRVVTASYVVPWHLGNTLKRIDGDFEMCVVGQGVSSYQNDYPDIKWVDIDLNRKINLLADLASLYRLCRFFLSYKPDIVHSIMPKAGLLTALAGFLCRVPVRIHTFTGQIWATKKSTAKLFFYALDKIIATLNTVCLTDSPSQSQYLYEHSISYAGKPLPVLGDGSLSGVDLTRFDLARLKQPATQLAKELGISQKSFVFSFIARKTRDKGAIDVIKAFAQVVKEYPQCLLLFVGPDESEGELETLMTETPELFNNVRCIDKVDNHELFLAVTDVLCLPSYREGFGTIVIDAAALSVPTIGSNIVGLVDAIDNNKTGILFPAGDINELTLAMLSFLKNLAQLKAMGAAARQRVECCFSADKLYADLKRFYFDMS